MAIIQLLQTLQAFYHLWVIIEVFQVKQTKFIENSVNKVDCRTKQNCDRRIKNIGLKSEMLYQDYRKYQDFSTNLPNVSFFDESKKLSQIAKQALQNIGKVEADTQGSDM